MDRSINIFSFNVYDFKIEYFEWRSINDKLNDPIEDILESLLCDLYTGIIVNGIQSLDTRSPRYKNIVKEYFKLLLKVDNYITYNYYYDKIIDIHIENIEFDRTYNDNLKNMPLKKGKIKAGKAVKKVSKFVRYQTTDMFTGNVSYIYENPETKESITSDDPNLLETLNAKNTKVKKERTPRTKKSRIRQPKLIGSISFKIK